MSGRSMADRNVLFGVLAVQLGYITPRQMVEALQAWTLDRQVPLETILVDKQLLSPQKRAMLAPLVQAHLDEHQGNAGESLQSISMATPVLDALAEMSDPEVQQSLAGLPDGPVARNLDGPVTQPHNFGESNGTRYMIVRPHAKGGLGEVFVARDLELERDVALKQIQAQQADHRISRARFLLEAEVTGKLEHPGIVPVYGLGTHPDGRLFYAMRFIQGDSFKSAIKDFHASPAEIAEHDVDFRKLLGRFVDVCNAIGYAHSRGVLHRDLKPDNVMLGKHGETLVVDWGLAKVKGRADDVGNGEMLKVSSGVDGTLPGSAVGTPGYLSPEQAEGKLDQMGPATDIYSLGATLYTLLTGEVTIKSRELADVLCRTVKGDFAAPLKVNPHVPAALNAICLKAMAVQPAARYQSCSELADDVERWLAGEPVAAYPEPLRKRAARWTRKHRTLVTSTMAMVIVAGVALAVGLFVYAGLNQQLDAGNQQLTHANEKLEETNQNLATANESEKEQRQRADEAARLADERRQTAERFVRMSTRLTMKSATQAIDNGDSAAALHWLTRAMEIALPQDTDLQKLARLRFAVATEDVQPLVHIFEHPAAVGDLDFTNDSEFLITCCWDKRLRLWSTRTGQLLQETDVIAANLSVDIHPEQELIVVGCGDSTVRLFELPTLKQLGEPLRPFGENHDAAILLARFVDDGQQILIDGDFGYAGLWSTAERKEVVQYGESGILKLWHRQAHLSDDNQHFVMRTVSSDTNFVLLESRDAATGQLQAIIQDIDQPLQSRACGVSDNNELFVTGTDQNNRFWLHVWDLTEPKRIAAVSLQEHQIVGMDMDQPGDHLLLSTAAGELLFINRQKESWELVDSLNTGGGQAAHIRVATDGRLAIVGTTNNGAAVIDLRRRVSAKSSVQTGAAVWGSDVSADKKLVAFCGPQGSVRLFRMPEPDLQAGVVDLHVDVDYGYSAEQNCIVRANADQSLVLQEISTGKTLADLGHCEKNWTVYLDDERGSLFLAKGDGNLELWNVPQRKRIATLPHELPVLAVRVSPDGKRLAICDDQQRLQMWEVATQKRLGARIQCEYPLYEYWLSDDPAQLMTVTQNGVYRAVVWDVLKNEKASRGLIPTSETKFVTLNPNGILLIGRPNGQIQQWDLPGDRMIGIPMKHETCAAMAAYSPDEKLLVSGSCDMTARLWDTRTGKQAGLSMEHHDRVKFVGFNQTGKLIWTVCDDEIVRIWTNADEPQLLHEIRHGSMPVSVRIDSHDRFLAIAGGETVSLWDLATGERLAIYFDLRNCNDVAFTPDGTALAMFAAKSYCVRQLPEPTTLSIDAMIRRSQQLTGMELNTAGEIVPLTNSAWQKTRPPQSTQP